MEHSTHHSVIRPIKVRDLTLVAPSSPERHRHLSAASGLVRVGDYLYVVADDEGQLAVFPTVGHGPGALTALLPGVLPAAKSERKARKPDFEALTRLPPVPGSSSGALLALGSGSTPNRRNGAAVSLDSSGEVIGPPRLIDFSKVCAALDHEFPALNIEGAAVVQDRLRLLHRASRHAAQSAFIDLSLADVWQALESSTPVDAGSIAGIQLVDLGSVDGVPLGFTDGAALPDGGIMFSAVAEDSENPYEDGPLVGAAIGLADAAGRVRWMDRLDATVKVEGIDAQVEGGEIRLLLVTDADDERIPASLLTAVVPRLVGNPGQD